MLVGCFCNIETDNDIPNRELFYQATNQRETTKYLAIIIQDVSDYEQNVLSIIFVNWYFCSHYINMSLTRCRFLRTN